MACVPGYLRSAGASRRVRTRAGGARRAADVPSGNRLTGEDLVVFPSNRQLSLRAHGMAPATLRRHLAVLVDAGLIVRRDSPNGKRYARKDGAGEVEIAFGFDLSPLVARADEFESLAEAVRAEERALKRVRERITICRRDIAKMIVTGIEEGVPTRQSRAGAGGLDCCPRPVSAPWLPGFLARRRGTNWSRWLTNWRCCPPKCSICWKLM